MAVQRVSVNLNLSLTDYTIISRQKEQFHEWYMEEQVGIDADKLMQLIDNKIGELNDDYAYVRKHALKKPVLRFIKQGGFYDFMKSQNKLGAQHKMPRVLNSQQQKDWEDFFNSL
jgi:hypothetical protein